jgi:3-hydroxyacyl-CoA dehydrogenase
MFEQVHISAEPQKIAILGFGLVGASWAALFLYFGFNVRAWDPL